MSYPRLSWLAPLLFAAAFVSLGARPALATSYTIYSLETDSLAGIGGDHVGGITADGSLFLVYDFHGEDSYSLYTPPSTVQYFGTDFPYIYHLDFDNGHRGAPCPTFNTSAYTYVYAYVCNGSQEVAIAKVRGQEDEGLFSGPDPQADLIYQAHDPYPGEAAWFYYLDVNAAGDIGTTVNYGIDPNSTPSDLDVSYDLLLLPQASSVTPEPSSLALLGTGVLAVTGGWVRRRRQA